MKTVKQLELSLIVKEAMIQQLKLKNAELVDKLERINRYVINNFKYAKVDEYFKME